MTCCSDVTIEALVRGEVWRKLAFVDPLIALNDEWTKFYRPDADDQMGFARRLSQRFVAQVARDIIARFDDDGAFVERRRTSADLTATGTASDTPLKVDLRLWARGRKNFQNRINEALADAVNARRAAADSINLDLVAVVTPRGVNEELSNEDILRKSFTLLRSGDGVGYDRVFIGFAGPQSDWLNVGDAGAAPRDYQHFLEEFSAPPAVVPSPSKAPRAQGDPSVLFVSDEWVSSHGGISTFNRTMAVALASRGFEVRMILAEYSSDDADEAREQGVTLYGPDPIPGVDSRSTLLSPTIFESGYYPDLVVGHGRVLGPYAYATQKLQFPDAQRLHIVHTDSESLEAVKESVPGVSRMLKADERRQVERELASSASLVAGVGPLLKAMISDELRHVHPAPDVFQLVPGLAEAPSDALSPPIRGTLLVLGRVEDFESKGVDLAARAAHVADAKLMGPRRIDALVIRGVQVDGEDLIATRVAGYFDANRIRLRPYSLVESELRADLLQATTVLMPSRHEGFGLSAYEAIGMGVPILISEASGLGKLLLEVDPHAPEVVSVSGSESSTIERWASAIAQNIADPVTAFARAAELRSLMDARFTWDHVADAIRTRL